MIIFPKPRVPGILILHDSRPGGRFYSYVGERADGATFQSYVQIVGEAPPGEVEGIVSVIFKQGIKWAEKNPHSNIPDFDSGMVAPDLSPAGLANKPLEAQLREIASDHLLHEAESSKQVYYALATAMIEIFSKAATWRRAHLQQNQPTSSPLE